MVNGNEIGEIRCLIGLTGQTEVTDTQVGGQHDGISGTNEIEAREMSQQDSANVGS